MTKQEAEETFALAARTLFPRLQDHPGEFVQVELEIGGERYLVVGARGNETIEDIIAVLDEGFGTNSSPEESVEAPLPEKPN